ncbi:cytochrome c553 [Sulfuricella denitrificans skB26]|uniref:Cytochrome c553 n=1 Tax=Sulfuricella denitrificans (strain DSM 22764 / NBRC 105220 / skB26) TaxID=1163617 RepID=S6A9J7_SULDS|nr:c-type cytochrome [Sulfuricella denitrificans]BAN34230.1 cytochrome c553 [Sulfuricella denitrificans skB26]
MERKLIKFVLLAGGLAVSSSLWAAPSTPAMLSNTCSACHGQFGQAVGPSIPTLAGQPASYIADAMKQFKSGERTGSVMGRVAKAYTDDDFNAMGEFFSQKKFVRYPQKVDAAKVAKGKELHEQNCKKCHTEGGRESEDGGVIAGQWSEYLHITMDDFASKKRAMPKKMAEKFEGLSKDDRDALVNFYASQQ